MKWNYNYTWSQHGLNDDSVEQQSQVSVGSGVMTITAIHQGQTYNGTYYNYTSGAINTSGKLNFTCGYIEASQEMAGNQGAWPAFWMQQATWPPEIDIQEDPEFQPDETSYPVNYHFTPAAGGPRADVGTTVSTGINLAGSFNTYAVDWEPNYLTFYFNNSPVYTVTSSQANVAQLAQEYLLIDLGVGGWPGEPPAGTYYPATLKTDWVRVWQQNGAAESGWNSSSGGSWDSAANWNNGVPTVSVTTAYFGAQAKNPAVISIDWSGSRTVNGLVFDSPTNYHIAATPNDGAGLMFSNAEGVPTAAETINITQTSAAINGSTINSRIELPYSLLTLCVNNASPAPIIFAGNMIGVGNLTIASGSAVISGNDSMTGTTTVTGGANLTITGQINSTSQLIVNGTLVMNANGNSGITLDSLGGLTIGRISTGASAKLSRTASQANRCLICTASISIAGATNAWTGSLDLSNNDLDIMNGNLAVLTNQIEQGFNLGGSAWEGLGITSSAAAGDTTHLTSLGVIQNSTTGLPGGPALYGSGTAIGQFDGISPASTDVLIKYTYYGDANLDGRIDGSDYSKIDASCVSERSGSAVTGWFNGDFNYDGVVNGSDYALIDNAFNMQGSQLTALPSAAYPTNQIAAASVPEPGRLVLLAGSLIAFAWRGCASSRCSSRRSFGSNRCRCLGE